MTPRPMLRPNGGLMQTQKYIEKTFKTPLLKNCDASIVIYDNLDCVGTIFNTVFLHCQILRHKRISCEFSIF